MRHCELDDSLLFQDIPGTYCKDGHVDGRKMRQVVRWGAIQKKIGVCCSDLKVGFSLVEPV